MEDLFKMLTAFMAQMTALFKRVEVLEERLSALEGQAKVSNHADLKTDDQELLSALMTLEQFFDATSFYTEHEGMAYGDYVNHRDLLETDYPIEISEQRNFEPLFIEAIHAFDKVKAHLIK